MKAEHSDLFNLIKLLKTVIFAFAVLIIMIIVGFLVYVAKISKDNYNDIDTEGVYNIVDSNGNLISTDLTSDDIVKIMENINGKN